MATHDFGAVEAFSDDNVLEVYVPFGLKSLGTFLGKEFSARFMSDGNKKRWVVDFRYCKKPLEYVLKAIEDHLYSLASDNWRNIVREFGKYACSSKKYEVKFGAGGVRLKFPAGHPLHTYVGEMSGEKPTNDIWRIPVAKIKFKQLAEYMARISEEDRDIFIDAIEAYEGIRLTGKINLKWSEAKNFGLGDDMIMFADYSFVKAIYPVVVPMPIHAWPFRVIKSSPVEGGIQATIEFMRAKDGIKSVGLLMATPRESRRPLLNESHIEEPWQVKLNM